MNRTSTNKPLFMGKTVAHAATNAKCVGPCKADHKPGDMVMPGGTKKK